MPTWDDDFAVVGRIARTQGHRGQVIVNVETDFADERFKPGATLWMRRGEAPVPVRIVDSRMHMGRPVLTLEGVATMTEAERLRGVELRVPVAELRALPAGAHYRHDLVGCVVETVDGRAIGTVRAVEGAMGAERLVVGEGRAEVQVPLATPICVSVNVADRRIVIDPPEGLLDLNA